jgi:hypothetical protein
MIRLGGAQLLVAQLLPGLPCARSSGIKDQSMDFIAGLLVKKPFSPQLLYSRICSLLPAALCTMAAHISPLHVRRTPHRAHRG